MGAAAEFLVGGFFSPAISEVGEQPVAGLRFEREQGPDVAEEGLDDPERGRADAKQALGDRDQAQSDRDQRAYSDYAHGEEGAGRAQTTAERAEETEDREQDSRRRDRTAQERDVSAQFRDELSVLRDEAAEGHDREAIDLDAKDDLADRHTLRVEELRGRGRATRGRAAGDRARAGRDRAQATGDRAHAGGDRAQAGGDRDEAACDRAHAEGDRDQAAHDREQAGIDELTGARRRGVGLEDLDNEMKRARRESEGRLVAAYVDVDGLKSVNDEQGHAAGDALLRTVAAGFRRHMRPYDLLVRLGGDEFLCALPNITLDEAQERFDDLPAELNAAGGRSVSIGYAELHDGDLTDDLVKRADSALLASRR